MHDYKHPFGKDKEREARSYRSNTELKTRQSSPDTSVEEKFNNGVRKLKKRRAGRAEWLNQNSKKKKEKKSGCNYHEGVWQVENVLISHRHGDSASLGSVWDGEPIRAHRWLLGLSRTPWAQQIWVMLGWFRAARRSVTRSSTLKFTYSENVIRIALFSALEHIAVIICTSLLLPNKKNLEI